MQPEQGRLLNQVPHAAAHHTCGTSHATYADASGHQRDGASSVCKQPCTVMRTVAPPPIPTPLTLEEDDETQTRSVLAGSMRCTCQQVHVPHKS
jgi:hypothetical protein